MSAAEAHLESETRASSAARWWQQVASVLLVACLGIAQWVAADISRRGGTLTFDEVFYTHLGMQILIGEDYNTRGVYEYWLTQGRKLPDLVNEPLFIHPPLFPSLIAASEWIADENPASNREDKYHAAVRVSILAGCLLVMLVFGLARSMHGPTTAWIAALMVSFDLNRWIASERVWIDATLAMLAWASVWLFWEGRTRRGFGYAAGVALGLALLAKYPAALIGMAWGSYLLLFERERLRDRHTYAPLALAGLLLVPWLWKVGDVYGANWWYQTIFGHGIAKERMAAFAAVVVFAGVLIGLAVRFGARCGLAVRTAVERKFGWGSSRALWLAGATAGLAMVFLIQSDVLQAIGTSLDWNGVPRAGWTGAFFLGEPWYFYLRQHIVYSPLYLLTLISLCRLPWATRGEHYLALVAFWVFAFGVLVGNYQSRYVLMMVPALVMLNARTIELGMRRLASWQSSVAPMAWSACAVLLAYCFAKSIRVVYLTGIVDNVAYY